MALSRCRSSLINRYSIYLGHTCIRIYSKLSIPKCVPLLEHQESHSEWHSVSCLRWLCESKWHRLETEALHTICSVPKPWLELVNTPFILAKIYNAPRRKALSQSAATEGGPCVGTWLGSERTTKSKTLVRFMASHDLIWHGDKGLEVWREGRYLQVEVILD